MSWQDFNNIEDNNTFSLIPAGEIAKVRMKIKPGGYNDPAQGITGGYATKNPATASIYLDAEFTILEGKFTNRRVFGKIGLHSEKSPKFKQMGQQFIKAILSSARGVGLNDISDQAKAARKINSFADLDNLEFLVRIDVEQSKNIIRKVITKDDKDYKSMSAMNTASWL